VDLGLRGKVALVVASSKGLGCAVAQELATEGASIAMCARGEDHLNRARDDITRTRSVDVIAIAGDVSNPDDVERIANTALDHFGHVDVLVTNAGGPPSAKFESISPDMWQKTVDQTLMSAINLTRILLPQMRQRRWGRIINITSITVKQPVEGLMLSNSIRAAVTGFARTLANEVARDGITVNNILPGYTRTERVEQLAEAIAERDGISAADARARWESEIPMGRLGETHEFAALAAFLASERASYITGTSITVDGGWTKGLL
jgi:3-oxoacyl-[acyl-carrier protein] reductase